MTFKDEIEAALTKAYDAGMKAGLSVGVFIGVFVQIIITKYVL